jgi:hypothetical protein
MKEGNMTEGDHLAETLKLYFTEKQNVFLSFSAATQGLTAEQVLYVPREGFNSIWGVVNHVGYWQEATLLIIQRSPDEPRTPGGSTGGWFKPDKADTAAWEQLRAQAMQTNDQLASAIAGLTDQQLHTVVGPWKQTPYQMAQSILAHNSYHICEIISLRHLQGLWVES